MRSDQCDCRNAIANANAIASPNIRTLFDITWSCFSTIFICTWVSVHPNLPPPGEAFAVTCARRLKIMLYTFLLPEFVLFWALQQWFGARMMVGVFGDRGWTRTHGFFLVMGGFHLHKGDEDLGVLSFDLLSELVESNEIIFPTMSAEHLQDKSKGDVITKSIALSQAIWFIIQCIARGAQGLVLTELELLTLALASLNSAMYVFWWEKPLDVRMYVPVYLREGVEFMHKPELRRVNLAGEKAIEREIEKAAHPIPNIWATFIPKPFRNVKSTFLTLFTTVLSKCRADWEDKHPIIFLLKWLPLLPLSLFFIPFLELTNEELKPGSSRVPTFYTHPIREERNDNIASATLLLFGVVFGGIHMIAWGFAFPSTTTQVIWRVSALAVTLIPVGVGCIIALSVTVSEDDPDKGKKRGWRSALDGVLSLLGVLLLMGYILARVVLLVEGLMLLKGLSREAYADVEWSRFIPHLR